MFFEKVLRPFRVESRTQALRVGALHRLMRIEQICWPAALTSLGDD
jgi:hypothetical protein